MADDTDNLVLEHLRYIRGRLDTVYNDVRDLKMRMTNLEETGAVASAAINRRLDRMDERIERIERRLDLAEA